MNTTKNKTTVLISYNNVNGLMSGWHDRKRLYVCANDAGRGSDTGRGRDDRERAGCIMHDISGKYYHGSVPVERVKHFYIYAGLYAFRQALGIAKSLRTEGGAPVTVVACNCEKSEKVSVLAGSDIDIVWSECGGVATMGRLAKQVMDINGS